MKTCSPRLPWISLFRTTLFSEPAPSSTPSSLSAISLFWIVLPLRPSSASKSSMPATAWPKLSTLSTTLWVAPELSSTPQPNWRTVPLRTITLVRPLIRMPAGNPSSWPVVFSIR